MYYCKECKSTFYERDAAMGETVWRGIPSIACPCCHSEEVVEAGRCDLCGDYIDPEERFCESCAEDLKISWQNMVNREAKDRGLRYEEMEEVFLDYLEREVF